MSDDQFTEAWLANRSYLVDLAYRMLGDIGESEDVVQVAYSRLSETTPGSVEDPRGWLTVVTSRLCLDRIRSARTRRETVYDASALESVARPAGTGPVDPDGAVDPADRITLDDDVRLALLVVLQRLTPAERVVYVLHDVFQTPFATIAEIVGRPEPTCRQLARRARAKFEGGAPGRRAVAPEEHRLVTERFIAACGGGDLDALLEVLAPDVWGAADLGPGAPHVARYGAAAVATNLLRLFGPGGATLVSYPGSDQPSVLAYSDRRLFALITLTIEGDAVTKLEAIADPAKMAFLESELADVS